MACVRWIHYFCPREGFDTHPSDSLALKMTSDLADSRRHGLKSRLSFADLSGRLLVHVVPVGLGVVMIEAALALSISPALRNILQESWLSLGFTLWVSGSVRWPIVGIEW